MCFLPLDQVSECRALIKRHLENAGISVLAWRQVPTNDGRLGFQAMRLKPMILQALLRRPPSCSPDEWERTLFLTRRTIGIEAHGHGLGDLYIASMSSRTIVYKGLMQASQLGNFYPDLRDEASSRRSPSFISATRRIPSRRGRWRSRSACSATTARSTPCRATWPGCRCARAGCSRRRGRRLGRLRPVVDTRGSDSAIAGQCARAAGRRRARYPPCADDAGAAGLGARRPTWPGPARLL